MAPDGAVTESSTSAVPADVAAQPDPHADWPDRTTLSDGSGAGAASLVFSRSQSVQGSVPWADGVWVPSAVDRERAAALAVDALPGWLFSTSDETLVAALLDAGASERRHAHSMSALPGPRDLPTVHDVRIEPLSPAQVDRHALRLGAIMHRAYPPGHPDALDGGEAAAVSQVRAIARGELLGPMLTESRVALFDGDIVGACLVVERTGDPPYGGPWVIDIFRDPACPARGVGAALLGRALTAVREAGLTGLSLVVSHDNARARRLYSRLGFTEVDESWTLVLPK
jgi:ribosomal protein S18 acetylase RimI-like enzyme